MKKIVKSNIDTIKVNPDGYSPTTYRKLFKEILTTLFEEGEMFSGKRAAWNSDWQDRIVHPLIDFGYVKGTKDPETEEYEYDYADAVQALHELVDFL